MSTVILDALADASAGYFPSAGIDRAGVIFIGCHNGAGNGVSPASVTVGGQSADLIFSGGTNNQASVSAWFLSDDKISAMVGNAISVSGATYGALYKSAITFSGAAQTLPTGAGASAPTGVASFDIELARVAGSHTVAYCLTPVYEYIILANPPTTLITDGQCSSLGVQAEPDDVTSGTTGDVSSRPFSATVVNVSPAGASGPTVSSITDPIIGNEPVTIVLSEAAPTVDTIEFTVGTVTQSQSYTTGDDTTFTITAPTRNLLPPIGTVTVTLKAGATEITSTTATLQEPAGWGVQVLSGVVDGDAVPHTGTLANGMIAYWDDYPNTTTNAGLTDITQTAPYDVSFYIWDPVTETYGAVAILAHSASSGDQIIKHGIITQSLITQGLIQ